MKNITEVFGQLDPDIVHVHNGYYLPHRDMARLAKNKGKKVVHTWHGGKIPQERLREIQDETSRIADYNFAISRLGKSSFSPNVRSAVEVAYGVDLSNFDPRKVNPGNVKKLKGKLGIKDDDFVYFFPARYSHQKNQHGLIEAFSAVSRKDPRSKLVLSGPSFDKDTGSSYLSDLKRLAKKCGVQDKVVFNGNIKSAEDVRDLYALSSAVIYPSRNEGRGRSLIEAMAMEKPVLASNDAGLKDSIERPGGNVGLLFDPDSQKEMVRSMELVKRNPSLRQKLARRARDYAKSELSIDKYAMRHYDLYTSLATAA